MRQKRKAIRLLHKYLQGKATDNETTQINNWYEGYEQKFVQLDDEKKKLLKEEILRNIERRITNTIESRSAKYRILKPVLQIAASLLIISITAFIFFKVQDKHLKTYAAYHTVETGNLEKRVVLLNDGSEVWIQPSSSFRYSDLTSGKRTVELIRGEAFFKVFHDQARPFRVKMPDGMYTQVLGTSFLISARQNAATIWVAVKSGKVAVGKENKLFGTFIRGQQITYNKVKQTSETGIDRSLSVTTIRFDHTSLKELVARLEWIYYVHIDIPADSMIQQLKCTGTFTSNQNVQEILQTICMLHNLKLNEQPDQQTFKIAK